MKAGYKNPPKASAASSRTLRTIQVQNKRAQERDQKVNQARKIEPAGASKENVSGSGRQSRKDRLEAYRLEKLAAQEKIKARQVVPFRAGVYHPEKKIKPLSALPRTRAAARTPLDRKTKVVPTKPRSSRTTPAPTSARRRKVSTPRSGKQLLSSYKNQSPKSFAPKNFQFTLNDVVTPVSQLITGFSRTNIETEEKTEAFKTPKSSRAKKKVGMTMQVESPLSAVSTVRGSSKRKRKSPETVNSVSALFEGLEGSPLLAKLEAKLSNNEEITENDFDQPPAAKLIKIDLDFDKIADEKEEQKEVGEPDHDVPYCL